jgi:parvulin-like peptidyl-prolyl isomerase
MGALQAAAIDEALFTLQVGQMSPILDAGPTFHIVRVLERRDAGRKPFSEVQGDIREKLKDERFKAGVEKYLASLRQNARIWTAFTGNVSADVLLGRKPSETQQR